MAAEKKPGVVVAKEKDEKKAEKELRTPYQRFSTGRPMPVRNVRSA